MRRRGTRVFWNWSHQHPVQIDELGTVRCRFLIREGNAYLLQHYPTEFLNRVVGKHTRLLTKRLDRQVHLAQS